MQRLPALAETLPSQAFMSKKKKTLQEEVEQLGNEVEELKTKLQAGLYVLSWQWSQWAQEKFLWTHQGQILPPHIRP